MNIRDVKLEQLKFIEREIAYLEEKRARKLTGLRSYEVNLLLEHRKSAAKLREEIEAIESIEKVQP